MDEPGLLKASLVIDTQDINEPVCKLHWIDNSDCEIGYKIYRKCNVDGMWTVIGSASEDAVYYVDKYLCAGNTYFYRVQAYNERHSSCYSDIASIKIRDIEDLPRKCY